MNETTITLPVTLADPSKFSLEEIGTIFVISCLNSLSFDTRLKWGSSEHGLSKIVDHLITKGVVSSKGNGELEVNLSESFWTLEEYDDNDNPIYFSPSPYGYEEDVPMYWRVRPKLVDLKILWINVSDAELIFDESELSFDSLEDAQKYFEEQNREIVASIIREQASNKIVDERTELESSFLARVENGL